MTPQEIHAELDKMFGNPKSRNFINHLVRSYIPAANVEKVFDKPIGNFKCVISGDALISIEEILEGMETAEFKAKFMLHIKTMLDDNPQVESPMRTLIMDKKLGLTGKNTTTFLSYPVYQEFYSWVITKALHGDKHINWLLGSVGRSLFIKRAETINDEKVQEKIEKIKKPKNVTTFNLGENDVLAQLKAKMEKNE